MKSAYAMIALAALAGSMAAAPANAITIDFYPVNANVALGESFAVDVVVWGLPDAQPGGEIVSAFDLDVLYDANVLSASGFEFSDALGLVGIDALTSSSTQPGRIDFASVSFLDSSSLFGLQDLDRLVLGRLLFDAIGLGESLLTFDSFTAPGVLLVGTDPFTSLCLTSIGSARINVSEPVSVPEPATLWLMLSGIAYIAWSRRRLETR